MVMMWRVFAEVDFVHQRRERRRLSRAGGTADEHEPARQPAQRLDARRQAEAGQTRHRRRQPPDRGRGAAALAMQVDAEAAEVRRPVGGVGNAGLANALRACGGSAGSTASAISSPPSGPSPIGTTAPATRSIGGAPATSSRSLADCATTCSSQRAQPGELLIRLGRPARAIGEASVTVTQSSSSVPRALMPLFSSRSASAPSACHSSDAARCRSSARWHELAAVCISCSFAAEHSLERLLAGEVRAICPRRRRGTRQTTRRGHEAASIASQKRDDVGLGSRLRLLRVHLRHQLLKV